MAGDHVQPGRYADPRGAARDQPSESPRLLPPSGFAVVMATGIVSVVAREAGLRAVSLALVVVAAAVYAVLAALFVVRTARDPAGVSAHLREPAAFGLLTIVAGTDVLAARDELAGALTLPLVLGALALTAWLLLAPAAVRVARRLGPAGRRRRARGEWLNLVVATQSLAIVAADAHSKGRVLPDLAIVAWLLGLAAYAALIVPIFRRAHTSWTDPRSHTPDAWIVMGALAISTLAAASLRGEVGASGAINVVAHATWVLASAGYVALVAIELRVLAARDEPAASGRWSTVFPLGMYSACSHALGFHTLGTITMAIALAAWLATAGVLAPQAIRRRATSPGRR